MSASRTKFYLDKQNAKFKGVCPAEVNLKATIKGVGGGEIKYWLEEVGGKGAAMQMTSNLPGKAHALASNRPASTA